MSIFDMFSATKQQPAQQPTQQQQPATPGNITAPTVPVTPTNEASAPVPAVPNTPVDPLDAFKDLWNNEQNTAAATPNSFMPEVNQDILAKAMGNVDFTSHITPDVMKTITEGGEGAMQAMLKAMNTVAQQAMIQSTLVNSKLSQQGITNAATKFEETVPQMLRRQQAESHARDNNPIFSNPAIKPVMEATQLQILQKFPNATPQEVTKMTQDYILAMGQAFAPKPDASALPAGETDWTKFLMS